MATPEADFRSQPAVVWRPAQTGHEDARWTECQDVLHVDWANGSNQHDADAVGLGSHVRYGREPNMGLMLSGEAWAKIHLSAERTATLIRGDDIPVAAGGVSEASRVLDLFDRYEPERAVVVPPKTLVQDRM